MRLPCARASTGRPPPRSTADLPNYSARIIERFRKHDRPNDRPGPFMPSTSATPSPCDGGEQGRGPLPHLRAEIAAEALRAFQARSHGRPTAIPAGLSSRDLARLGCSARSPNWSIRYLLTKAWRQVPIAFAVTLIDIDAIVSAMAWDDTRIDVVAFRQHGADRERKHGDEQGKERSASDKIGFRFFSRRSAPQNIDWKPKTIGYTPRQHHYSCNYG